MSTTLPFDRRKCKSRKASRDVHRGKKTGKSSTKFPKKNKDPHRNSGVARHRPKTQFAGVRIGEADHPGPCHVHDCQHDDCTRFGHHHRPKGFENAKKRVAEKQKKKNGSSKPARWTACAVHLEAGKCGIDKPHGHCQCKTTAHFNQLIHEYTSNVTAYSPPSPTELMDALESQQQAEREAEVTDTWNDLIGDFSFILEEHKQFVSQEPSAPPLSHQSGNKPATQLSPATAGDETPASSDFNTPSEGVPSPDENKESLTDESSTDDSDSSEYDDSDLDYLIWSDDVRNVPTTQPPATPELQRMTIFLNAEVGDENLDLFSRMGNWCKMHLPFTKLEESSLVNAASANLFSESLNLSHSNVAEVHAFWRKSEQPGIEIAQANGTLALFRKLLPACMEVEVYKKILDAASTHPSLNKACVVTRSLQISSALGPIVTDFVYSQASKLDGRYDNPSLLTWTVVAIMNQLTAASLVKRMAGSGSGMDFRTRGRSRITRS